MAIISAAASTLFAAVVAAQEPGLGRDPFYPSDQQPDGVTIRKNTDWGKDPFDNPLGGATVLQRRGRSSPGQSRNLTGIIYSNSVRLAVIGGVTVREGGRFGDKKLVAIRKRSVVVMNSTGGHEEMFLEDFSIRK